MVDRNVKFQIAAHAVMALLCLFCLLPFVLLAVSSVTTESSLIRNGYTFVPSGIDLSAYKYLLANYGAVVRGYEISLCITFTGTIVNLALTITLAYSLSQKGLPGRNLFSFFVFFPLLFGGGLVPTYIMWTRLFHINNTLWALLIPGGLLLGPFNVIMMRTYFRHNIPEAVIESARIEGASEIRILSSIVSPMSLPIIATVATLVCLAYWNDWMNGLYFINDDRLFSIQVLLNKMLQNVEFLKSSIFVGVSAKDVANLPSTALRMAVAFLGVLPMLLAFPFLQRYFIKGISIGAVKE